MDGRPEGFDATVRITNTGEVPFRGWRIDWTWPDGQRLVMGRNARFQESGASVTVRNNSGNAEVPAGASTTFDLRAAGSGSPAPRLTCHVL
ncbi:hypothetical protein HCC61_08695 [Streptomyces sp. HNM0575]|nr:hypothetical protein [Streptomyces sp. HNM0575]